MTMTDTSAFRARVRMEETNKGRQYVWRDKLYWSVTTIISGGVPKPWLGGWAAKMVAEGVVNLIDELPGIVRKDEKAALKMIKGFPWTRRDEAADIGTAVHDAAEALVLGKPWPELKDPRAAASLDAFRTWFNDFRPHFLSVEAPVYSDKQRYAGTLDAIIDVEIDGVAQRLLIDYKTGKDVYSEVGLQLAAYRYAEAFLGLPDGSEADVPAVDGCAVVHLRPEGYRFLPIRADEEIFRAFLFAREMFRFSEELADTVVGDPVALPDEALARQLALSIEQTEATSA